MPAGIQSQPNITFQHITTLNGLSDNHVVNASFDRNGFLWICTTEGLNKYDGRVMEIFTKEDVPALRNNNIRELVCDQKNRLWIRSFGGYISMLDEKRQWHAINITDGKDTVDIYNIIQTSSRGIVLFRGDKQFVNATADTSFKRWHFDDDTVFNQRLYYYSHLSPDKVIWTGKDEFFIMNYETGKIDLRKKMPGITSAVAFNNNELYITTSSNGGLFHLDINTGELRSLTHLSDQFGKAMFSSLQMIRKMADNRLIITSAFAGIYVFDPVTNQLYRYPHDPLNNRTVSSNHSLNLVADSSGYVLIASLASGLSYFNVHDKPASWVPALSDNNGLVFDGYINSILQSNQSNTFWLGGFNQLIRWNKLTGKAEFVDYNAAGNGESIPANEEVLSLANDGPGNVWVGTGRNGITVLNANGKYLGQIKKPFQTGQLINRVNYLLPENGKMWAATSLGLWYLDTKTRSHIPLSSNHLLRQLDSLECGKLWWDSQGRLWIATARNGAFCFDSKKNTLQNFAKPPNGHSMEVFDFEEDKNGRIYLGTHAGLQVYDNDRMIELYNQQNGLKSDRCENLLKDAKGRIWIDNHTCIFCFDPVNKTFAVYDEKSGLSPFGSRPHSSFKSDDGMFYLGNETGFSYFHPDSIRVPRQALKVSVTSIQHDERTVPVPGNQIVDIPTGNNQLVVHFSAISLDQSKTIYYRYRLQGFDKQWITEPNISSVRYNALLAGQYRFELLASGDGINWVNALTTVPLEIKPAYWQTGWFRFTAALLLAIFFYFSLKQREKRINLKAEERARVEEMRSQALQYQLEIEQVINYFANSISSLHTVDDVVWGVVKTCISQLGFQDCVVYLYNKERTLLLQKAAYGPKNIDYKDIYNRIEVAPGSGIVGNVANTGLAEIINDTSKDARYIPDDAVRLSEIAIPLIGSTGIIGVIDSEHPEANFYNNRHLQILTAIGSMVVNKTEQLEAEANSRNKEVEMARLQRDVATLQLTATRAQMNPHFIFNALNSVQQYILQGNTDEANKYLSKFSRLQREILNHCDRPFISLQKEMEMLKMYLQLEQLRFNGDFEFDITADKMLDAEEIRIPPMILQPFVENAIWHGLMPKNGQRKVSVTFCLEEKTDLLYCNITDNGIGRQAAANNKIQNLPSSDYVSKGLSLVYKRLQLLQEQMGKSFTSTINDLVDEEGNGMGTTVQVTMFTGF
ncbi:MAG: histidine kinase [Bacteroidota bacterium]